MSNLRVSLFGKLHVQQDSSNIDGIDARKVQELLVYLLLFRDHPQSRELLCEVLWGENTIAASRKHLRQTLWRLQSALKPAMDLAELELVIDNDWIQINLSDSSWLDVAKFEKAFAEVKGKPVEELNKYDFELLECAAEIYRGDLLEGWYADWCIFERERFQNMHLTILDKLAQYCELHKRYEEGVFYGIKILRHDRANEKAHRQLMRLYFMMGNRTQALYQYERCVKVLRIELGVDPSESTKKLYKQICQDHITPYLSSDVKNESFKTHVEVNPLLMDVIRCLDDVSLALHKLEYAIQEEISLYSDKVFDKN